MTSGSIYRFRYRAGNLIGWSNWSPVAYLSPASTPSAPAAPQYVSSNDTTIVLNLFGSEDDGGAPILNYELDIDNGTLTSNFTPMSTYSYAVNGFTFSVDSIANNLTTGTLYRFRFRSMNAMGYSDYSDTARFGLGPLPTAPGIPTRATVGNSDTSIGVTWTGLTG